MNTFELLLVDEASYQRMLRARQEAALVRLGIMAVVGAIYAGAFLANEGAPYVNGAAKCVGEAISDTYAAVTNTVGGWFSSSSPVVNQDGSA